MNKETLQNMKNLIAKCVVKNIIFDGSNGAKYDVASFFNGRCTLSTIKIIGEKYWKRCSASDGSSPFTETASTKDLNNVLRYETCLAIVAYKKAIIERTDKAAATRAANAQDAEALRKVIAEKKYEEMSEKSRKSLEKQLADKEAPMDDFEDWM